MSLPCKHISFVMNCNNWMGSQKFITKMFQPLGNLENKIEKLQKQFLWFLLLNNHVYPPYSPVLPNALLQFWWERKSKQMDLWIMDLKHHFLSFLSKSLILIISKHYLAAGFKEKGVVFNMSMHKCDHSESQIFKLLLSISTCLGDSFYSADKKCGKVSRI